MVTKMNDMTPLLDFDDRYDDNHQMWILDHDIDDDGLNLLWPRIGEKWHDHDGWWWPWISGGSSNDLKNDLTILTIKRCQILFDNIQIWPKTSNNIEKSKFYHFVSIWGLDSCFIDIQHLSIMFVATQLCLLYSTIGTLEKHSLLILSY